MVKVTLVSDEGGDWEGLYVDGELLTENHSLSAWHILSELSQVFGFEFKSYEANGEWMYDVGHFPSQLDECIINE